MKGTGGDTEYARLAARVLADATPPAAVSVAIADRAGAIAAIGDALRARRTSRKVRQVWVSAAVAALTAAGVGLALWPLRGPVARLSAPSPTAKADPLATLTIATVGGDGAALETARGSDAATAGTRIEPGTRLRAAAGTSVTAALGTGTRVRFSSGAVARVSELGASTRFVLEAGSFEASVAKLAPNQRFLVATPDAEIEVRGTAFEVTVGTEAFDCAGGVRTRVVVREGSVVVRHGGTETRVSAGTSWPGCSPRADVPSATIGPRPALHATRVRARGGASVTSGGGAEGVPDPAPGASASSLAEQNDLFAAALAARRRGDLEEALRWLDRLLARYPTGQLVDAVRAERQRLLDGRNLVQQPASRRP